MEKLLHQRLREYDPLKDRVFMCGDTPITSLWEDKTNEWLDRLTAIMERDA